MGLVIPIVVLGLLGSLSPTTIVVFIVLLATARAKVNAAAFLVGWTLSLTVVFAASYAVGGTGPSRSADGGTVIEAIEVVLGVVLILVVARQLRRRDRPAVQTAAAGRGLMARVDQLSPWEATAVGVLEQPWTLTAAAAVIVARHNAAAIVALIAFLLFTLASTATVGLTFVYFARRPGQAQAHLAALRARVVAAGPAIVGVVSLAVGTYLVIDGLRGML